LARASVSKTEGRGFKSLHPCHIKRITDTSISVDIMEIKIKNSSLTRETRQSRSRRIIIICITFALIFSGAYLLLLTFSANEIIPISSQIDLNTTDDAGDTRNRIQIEKINLEVPFYAGDINSLERGVWWRYPDRGDPIKGGNFILSAHRFNLGLTPQGTKAQSPFYNLQKLEPGDSVRVFYDNKWYDYTITKKYSVKPTAIEIEDSTEQPRMTLYTCTLKGSLDGREVIEAELREATN